MNSRGWQPHATYYAATQTSQESHQPPAAPTALAPVPAPNNQTREEGIVSSIQAGFKSITATLILTGIAIGFASAIGSALGAILVNRYMTKPRNPGRR